MIQIKNWSSYQSYKDRNPPWIRLHKRLLDDMAFQRMSSEARAMLPMLWLLAAEDENPVSGVLRFGYEVVAFRLRMPEKVVESAIMEICRAGFIELKNESKTDSYGTVTDSLRNCHSETETETETETEKEDSYESSKKTVESHFDEFWEAYPKKRAGSKDKARAAYLKAIKRASEGEIIHGTRVYAASEEVSRGYAKGAAAWLNDDRWATDYKQPRNPTAHDAWARGVFEACHDNSGMRRLQLDDEELF